MKNTGVKILLEPEIPLPFWVMRQSPGGHICDEPYHGRVARLLWLPGGEARISMDGDLEIKEPDSEEFRKVVEPRVQALEFYDMRDNCLQQNPRLCTQCRTLSGEPSEAKERVT